jgi:hypothetical protein
MMRDSGMIILPNDPAGVYHAACGGIPSIMEENIFRRLPPMSSLVSENDKLLCINIALDRTGLSYGTVLDDPFSNQTLIGIHCAG